jgi:hypothetical protein
MIDLLTSKLAMMVAAAIILTTVLGVYAVQREHGRDLELRSIAETISGTVDEMNSVHGETKLNFTFSMEAKGRFLKSLVNGKNYEILITTREVIITQEDRHFEEDFMTPIHLWKPERNSFTAHEVESKDLECGELVFTSGKDFTIERMRIVVGGEGRFLTFVYL